PAGVPHNLSHYVSLQSIEIARLKRLNGVDHLTGLPNGRKLEEDLPKVLKHTQEQRKALYGAYVDLDGFKLINDNCGHQVGDAYIARAARAIEEALRSRRHTDCVYRVYKGDEFVILLPGADQDHAYEILTDVLQTLRTCQVRASVGGLHVPAGKILSADA